MSLPFPPQPVPRGIEWKRVRRPGGRWAFQYRARWVDPLSGRRRGPWCATVDEALTIQARVRVARAHGELASLTRGDLTTEAFVEREWWPRYAKAELEFNTRASYASVWNNHLCPHIGHLQLRHLTSPIVSDLRDELLRHIGTPTVRRALTILQGICTFAVEAGALPGNPVRDVRKPRVTRQLSIDPPSPRALEALRAELGPRDRALVALIGYEGLRPSEALGLSERHVGDTVLLVERRLIRGQLITGQKIGRKRERSSRSPDLFAPVREDLDAHLATLERRGRRRLLFPRPDGEPWGERDIRRWVDETWRPALERAQVEIERPYHLRHGAASLLLHAGWPVTRIAEHMGHSVQTLSEYYAHEIADLRDATPVPVEQQITKARARQARRRRP